MKSRSGPTRVLFLYPNEFFGPELTVYAQIIRHLDRQAIRPYLALNSAGEGSVPLADDGAVEISRWAFGTSFRSNFGAALRSGLRLPRAVIALAAYARRERIGIVHASATPRSASLGLLLARLTGAYLLLHYHVIPGRYSGPRGWVERALARRADCLVAVSRFLAGRVRDLGGCEAHVVTNGVDCARFNPGNPGAWLRREYDIAADEVLVLQLARLIQQKRQHDVVRAFALARREVPNLRCLLVGWEDPRYSGPFPSYRAELEAIRAAEGLGDSLIIAPARPEAPELLAAADIVVMPTLEDAWNLVVTEAMATGKPVIGSDSGGIGEQIRHGETGFLVPPQDPAALARAIVRLAADPELRERTGAAASREAGARFDEKYLAAAFTPLYQSLASGRGAPAVTADLSQVVSPGS